MESVSVNQAWTNLSHRARFSREQNFTCVSNGHEKKKQKKTDAQNQNACPMEKKLEALHFV